MGVANRLARLVEHWVVVWEVAGSNLSRTNTQGLKITEDDVLLCNDTCKWLDVQVFSDKDYKP